MNPETLQQIFGTLSNQLQIFQTSLDDEDNEIIVQYLLTSLTNALNLMNLPDRSYTLNEILDSVNISMGCMGYTMHHRQISRNELNNFIYYARITPDGQMLRNQYHPIRLREIMTELSPPDNKIPDSFEKMFSDRDYLPNIMNVWDRGHPDSIILLSYQKLNIHFQPPSNEDDTDYNAQL